jgi:hypothetical protein
MYVALNGWNGVAVNLLAVWLAVVARSSIERLLAYKRSRLCQSHSFLTSRGLHTDVCQPGGRRCAWLQRNSLSRWRDSTFLQ